MVSLRCFSSGKSRTSGTPVLITRLVLIMNLDSYLLASSAHSVAPYLHFLADIVIFGQPIASHKNSGQVAPV